MKRHFIVQIVSCFCLFLLLFNSSCTQPELKFTAEESGYFEAIKGIIPYLETAVKNSSAASKYPDQIFYFSTLKRFTRTRYNPTLKRKAEIPLGIVFLRGENPESIVEQLNSIIPPNNLSEFHDLIIKTLESDKSLRNLVRGYSRAAEEGAEFGVNSPEIKEIVQKNADLEIVAIACIRMKNAFYAQADNRPPQKNTGDELVLTYQPPVLPLEVSYARNSGFSIEASPNISTPIGDFGTQVKEGKGVKKLIIKSEGKERHFKLDRPFKFTIPAEYGIDVSGDGAGTMTIEVKKRPTA